METSYQRPEVCNIKFHFRIEITPEFLSQLESIKGVRHNNFIVIREKKLVFTVFHKNGHINITGVRDFTKIELSLKVFNTRFKTNIALKDTQIDNSTSSGYFKERNINLVGLKNFIKDSPYYRDNTCFSLRPQFFPGAVLRRKGRSTVIFFKTGKYIIIGAKNRQDIEQTWRAMRALMTAYLKTQQLEKKYVQNADS